jgi:hypothetical protein
VDDHRGLRIVDKPSRLASDALRELGRPAGGLSRVGGPWIGLGAGRARRLAGSPPGGLGVFDIGAFQLRLDALRQQWAEIAGQALHVVHAEGRGPSPLPLLLTHG